MSISEDDATEIQVNKEEKGPKKENKKQAKNDPIENRLDALIALIIEVNNPRKAKKFNEGVAARILKSAGLTPTEIAKILGKKSATDVAQYLYPKKKS
jgi:hypothetical protein